MSKLWFWISSLRSLWSSGCHDQCRHYIAYSNVVHRLQGCGSLQPNTDHLWNLQGDTWGSHGAWVDASPPNVTWVPWATVIVPVKLPSIWIPDTGEKRPSASRGHSGTHGLGGPASRWAKGTAYDSWLRVILILGLFSSWELLPSFCLAHPPTVRLISRVIVSWWFFQSYGWQWP